MTSIFKKRVYRQQDLRLICEFWPIKVSVCFSLDSLVNKKKINEIQEERKST